MKRKYNNPFGGDGSNSDLARKVGISASHLSLILAGKRSPSLTTLRALVKALAIPVEDLLNRLPPLVKAKERVAKKAARKTARKTAKKA